MLIAPPDSREDSLIELLKTYEWIQFDTTLVSGRMAGRTLHRLAPRARGSVEVDSIDTVHALVSAGRGISVVPKRNHLISKVLPVREIPLDDAHERESRSCLAQWTRTTVAFSLCRRPSISPIAKSNREEDGCALWLVLSLSKVKCS